MQEVAVGKVVAALHPGGGQRVVEILGELGWPRDVDLDAGATVDPERERAAVAVGLIRDPEVIAIDLGGRVLLRRRRDRRLPRLEDRVDGFHHGPGGVAACAHVREGRLGALSSTTHAPPPPPPDPPLPEPA